MCLFPQGGGIALPVTPGSEVDKWRKYFLYVCAGHAILGVLNLATWNVWDGIIDLMGAGIGYYGCREQGRILPTMILCYTVLVIMSCFWAALTSLLLLSDVKEVSGPEWRKTMYAGLQYGSVFFYSIAIFVARKLYKLLQRQYNETMGHEQQGAQYPGGGGGVCMLSL
mmetsp:Transcript_3939/g.5811  ORF Transcript_3939/g.5811 Transcript_3939/m.5811 type:complete len:168 (-) Transcript_3939:363-866(-)